PVLRCGPKQVPVPTVPTQAPGPGTPAARFRVATAYKGAVGPQMTVRLLGSERRFRTGETWTVFADRSHGHLFTTECSGNQPAAIDGRAYGLTAQRPVAAAPADTPPVQLYWVLGVFLAVAAAVAAAGTLLVVNRRRRPAAADLEPGQRRLQHLVDRLHQHQPHLLAQPGGRGVRARFGASRNRHPAPSCPLRRKPR